MKKLTILLLIPLIFVSLPLTAQSKREASLKSLTTLYEKNKAEAKKAMEELVKENHALSYDNRRLIIDLEDAKHQASVKETALKEAQMRIEALEEEVELLKKNPARNQVRDVEVMAMARTPDLEPFGPSFSRPAANSGAATNDFNAPYSEGTVLLVNINSATEKELRMIPGVGGNLAKRIVENRPYDSIWGLMKLEGMGKKRVDVLSPYMTIE